jgi:hypothetical protein
MAVWLHTLDLSDIWAQFEELGFESSRNEIVRRIKASPFYKVDDNWLDDAVWRMEDAEDIDDFNYGFDIFYDYADHYRIWVKTF